MVPTLSMKLQKQKVGKSGDKEYFKWVIILPQDRINQLGWKEGIELIEKVKNRIKSTNSQFYEVVSDLKIIREKRYYYINQEKLKEQNI